MKINHKDVAQVMGNILQTPHVLVDAIDLSFDIKALAQVWEDPKEFSAAVLTTQRALNLVVNGDAHYSKLKRDLAGWNCFHYLHSRDIIGRADMRLVFRRKDEDVEVLGFGHRYLPMDFYDRVTADRARKQR